METWNQLIKGLHLSTICRHVLKQCLTLSPPQIEQINFHKKTTVPSNSVSLMQLLGSGRTKHCLKLYTMWLN